MGSICFNLRLLLLGAVVVSFFGALFETGDIEEEIVLTRKSSTAVTPYVVKFTLTFPIFEQEITRMTDSFEQYRHGLMRKLAYEYWERRGRPFGSSEVDWSAAEKAIDPYLLTSG